VGKPEEECARPHLVAVVLEAGLQLGGLVVRAEVIVRALCTTSSAETLALQLSLHHCPLGPLRRVQL
jgi:hypothetical protein